MQRANSDSQPRLRTVGTRGEAPKRTTNSKPIPHIPLPFKEVMADVLKVKPPQKTPKRVKMAKPK